MINPERQKQHPAPFPPQLVVNCIELTTQDEGLVLDPFMGSGTTAIVAKDLNRFWMGFTDDIDDKWILTSQRRA